MILIISKFFNSSKKSNEVSIVHCYNLIPTFKYLSHLMEFTQQDSNLNSVISIGESSITLSHISINIPCFISSSKVEEVSISSLKEISKETLFPLLSQQSLDLLIIGTGKNSKFLSPKQQVSLSELGIGIECMNNVSACSSFNLLLSDLRPIGLLIL